MRQFWIPLLVTTTASADPIGRAAIPEGADINPDPPVAQSCGCEVSAPPKLLQIHGKTILKSSGEPGIGVTVVMTGGKEVYTAIADEQGEYRIDAPVGIYSIVLYYLSSRTQLTTDRMIVTDVELDPVIVDDTSQDYVCWGFGPHVPPLELTSQPYFGGTASRTLRPISRDRTHRAWIAPAAMADPARAATTLEGGRRFTGSPGVPLAFVDEVVTHTVNVPIELAQGGGGATAVALRSGSNDRRGDARVVLGVDDKTGASAGAETFAGGPLVKDHLWAAAGLVTRREHGELGSDGMLRIDAHASSQHEFLLVGLAHASGDDRAGWSEARWKAKLLDAKVELGAIATGELLERPRPLIAREIETELDPAQRLDRVGGLAYTKLRFHAHGYHMLFASAGAGSGRRDDTRHTDATYAIGDDWMITPAVTVTAGVRSEQRTLGADRTVVVAPRATLSWDPTKEGRSQLFVAYQRVPLVDDGLPGDFKSLGATAVDELATGVSYRRPLGQTMMGIAARAREDRVGGEAWVRRETARSVIHLQATSLDRIATLVAQHKLRDRGTLVTVGAVARVAEARQEGGAALGWKHSGSRTELTSELSIEGYTGTAGPGGRMILGILW